ncbi:MAG: NAD-dependent epimerase/dehydratase family protein [Simkaniaceae bacterium]|nr:NAD-dependent epimerase/dehydratase family protein [Candidatus Sacchlamyda saccharinae]
MNTKKIVISGITSALGISLAKLLISKGYQVTGFSRNIEKAANILDHPAIELQSGDLLNKTFLESVSCDAAGVIHLAALSSPFGRYRDFYATNVVGTKLLTDVALERGVQRFVHVSTPSLYFDYRDRYQISEVDPLPHKRVNAYASTKRMAETVVDEAQEKGLETVTIRPRAIFGPHDQALLPRVLKVCSEKGIPLFRDKSPIVDVTYVDNVALALWLSLEASSDCVGQKYNITNGEPVHLWELISILLKKLSLPVQSRKIPYKFAHMAAYLAEISGTLRKKEPTFTRYSVGVMSFSQTLNIEKARNELNYQPQISLIEGIKRYVSWLQTS